MKCPKCKTGRLLNNYSGDEPTCYQCGYELVVSVPVNSQPINNRASFSGQKLS